MKKGQTQQKRERKLRIEGGRGNVMRRKYEERKTRVKIREKETKKKYYKA